MEYFFVGKLLNLVTIRIGNIFFLSTPFFGERKKRRKLQQFEMQKIAQFTYSKKKVKFGKIFVKFGKIIKIW